MATPHINAEPGDFAETVLMPGDPLRSKYIAESFLGDTKMVNNVRGIHGYTGTYKGKRVSVMASGMGMPSMGIYSYELFNFFGVENIIRIGSAGAVSPSLDLYDIVAGIGACTDSGFAKQYGLPGTFAPVADFTLLTKCVGEGKKLGVDIKVGNLISSDTFYSDNSAAFGAWKKMGVLAIEMETAALYMNAARAGKRALAICTVSDCPEKGTETTAGEREKSFTQMMEIALNTAINI